LETSELSEIISELSENLVHRRHLFANVIASGAADLADRLRTLGAN
jgi:hypothetical protein